MIILKSFILSSFPELIFGFSTNVNENKEETYKFNLSHSVGENKDIVNRRRAEFVKSLGFKIEDIAFQNQIHSNIVRYVTKGGFSGKSDALITDKAGIGLAISTADCTPVFIYDFKNKIVAGVHSGWKGTELNILQTVLNKMFEQFNCKPENLVAYIGPSISQNNYEVGKEFLNKFREKYIRTINDKYYLDVALVNYDTLLASGLDKKNIQLSKLCTYENKNLFHSYRRDGKSSGRQWGIIGMKK